jgi:molecular chaperone DnaK (HSP70)
MSFGVETVGGIMSPIISKGTILPVSKTQSFTNSDSHNEIDIRVFQGERRLVKDNLFLGCFKIILDKTIKTNVIIQVTFDINSDGILIVTAKEKSQTHEKMLIITNYLKQLDEIYTYSDEFEKIQDSEMSSKILAKVELNNVFQIFSYKKQQMYKENIKLQQLLNEISDIIRNFEKYTTGDLIEYKNKFQEEWHIINLT